MNLPDNGPLRGLCIMAILLAMAILTGAVVHRVRRDCWPWERSAPVLPAKEILDAKLERDINADVFALDLLRCAGGNLG